MPEPTPPDDTTPPAIVEDLPTAEQWSAQVRRAEAAEGGLRRLRAELAQAHNLSNIRAKLLREAWDAHHDTMDERDALRAELALHTDCRTDISIGDALRLIRAPHSPAEPVSPVSTPTEAHGETGEAQEARE